jgi:hypothetical protein
MGGAEPHRAHLYNPYGEDQGSHTFDATSCSWGATDLGPTLSVFDKHRFSLWQGQQAPPLARLDYLHAESNFFIFFRA